MKVLKSNGSQKINRDALDYFRRVGKEMLDYFQTHHSRRIAGSSILLIVDNVNMHYEMRIIDLSSCYDFEDLTERDEGYILGL